VSDPREEIIRQLMIDDLKRHDAELNTHKSKPALAPEPDISALATAGLSRPSEQVLPLSVDPVAHSPEVRAQDTKFRDASASDNAAAIGSVPVEMARRVGNILLPKWLQGQAFSNDTVRDREQTQNALPGLPRFLTEQAMLAPLSAASGGAASFIPATTKLAKTAVSLGRAGAEGAAAAELTAPIDSRGSDALKGAGINSTIQALLPAGARVLTKALVKKSDAAKNLEQMTGVQLPLAHAASDEDPTSSFFKLMYGRGLPNIPIAGGMLAKQEKAVAAELRNQMLDSARPPGKIGASVNLQGSPSDQIAQLRKAFDDHYDDIVNLRQFHIPAKMGDMIKAKIRDSMTPLELAAGNRVPQIIQDKLEALLSGNLASMSDGQKLIGGRNLMDAHNVTSEMYPMLNGAEQKRLPAALSTIDDLIKDQAPTEQADNLVAGKERYSLFKAMESATNAAKKKQGNFDFGQAIEATSGAMPGTLKAQAHDISDLAKQTIDDNKINGNWAGRYALGAVGAPWLLHSTGPVTTGLVGLGAAAAGSKGMQNFLMGQTHFQQQIAEALRKNPELYGPVSTLLRNSAVTEANDNAP